MESYSEYIEFNDGKIEAIYIDMGDGWTSLTLSDYDDTIYGADILQKQLQQEMTDNMYPFEMLVRTNYGYALSEDKMEAYYNENLPSITESMTDIFEDMIGTADIMHIEYKDLYCNLGLYVKDGLLSECMGKLGATVLYTFNFGNIVQDVYELEMLKNEMNSLGFNCEFDDQGNLNMLYKMEATYQGKFYDYGTTEITKMNLPTGLENYLAQKCITN